MTETSSGGTSTTQVGGGPTLYRNGGSGAKATKSVAVNDPAAPALQGVRGEQRLSNTVTPINAATGRAGRSDRRRREPAVRWRSARTAQRRTSRTSGAGTVTPITVATNTPGTAITVGSNPRAVAFSPDGTKAT